jgi:erythromycin esterase
MISWLLLLLTVGCAYVTYDAFRWRKAVGRAPFSVIAILWKGGGADSHSRGGDRAIVSIMKRCVPLGMFLLVSSGIAHCEDDAFSKWAAAHAVPLATVEPGEDFSDLLPLKSVVGTARVVALGETHGAHEHLAFRNRLFRFLVEQMGFTAIALEWGFLEAGSVNAFVGGGPGDARSAILAASAQRLTPYVQDAELIQWMRDYNAAAKAAGRHPIRFYGINLTAGGSVDGPRRAIDYALAYLSRADPADADRIRSSLDDSLPSNEWRYGMLPPRALASLDDTIPQIAKAMAKNRSALIAHSSVEEYRWALHNLEAARQLAKCFHVTTPLSFKDMKDAAPVMACRGQAMAENVRWVVENEGPKGRVLVFASNAHVINGRHDGRRWAAVPEKPLAMGAHLRRAFGKRLLIIAMSSVTVSAGFPTPHPIEGAIDDTLAHVGLPKMFLDLRTARQDPAVLAWLSRQRPFRDPSSHGLITPATAVDVFVFIDRLTLADEIKTADAQSH